jgi:predicted Co/Zn/Cd cation transporter (cation efflux family)
MSDFHICDVDVVKKGKDNLLHKAMKKLNRLILKTYSDDIGLVAFEVDDFVVVAKKYVLRGVIVSAHVNAVRQALELGKDMLMYISERDKFYVFYPHDIINKGTRNRRGGSEFINFDIKMGREFSE